MVLREDWGFELFFGNRVAYLSLFLFQPVKSFQ